MTDFNFIIIFPGISSRVHVYACEYGYITLTEPSFKTFSCSTEVITKINCSDTKMARNDGFFKFNSSTPDDQSFSLLINVNNIATIVCRLALGPSLFPSRIFCLKLYAK